MDFWKNPHLLLVMSKQILCHHHLFLWASTRAASTRFSWHVFCSKNLIFFSKVKTEEYKVCWWDFSPHITGLSQLALIPDTLSGWNSHGAGVSTTVSLLKFHLMLGLVTDTTVFNVLSQSMVSGYRLKLNSPPGMTERLLPLIQPLLTRVEKNQVNGSTWILLVFLIKLRWNNPLLSPFWLQLVCLPVTLVNKN